MWYWQRVCPNRSFPPYILIHLSGKSSYLVYTEMKTILFMLESWHLKIDFLLVNIAWKFEEFKIMSHHCQTSLFSQPSFPLSTLQSCKTTYPVLEYQMLLSLCICFHSQNCPLSTPTLPLFLGKLLNPSGSQFFIVGSRVWIYFYYSSFTANCNCLHMWFACSTVN